MKKFLYILSLLLLFNGFVFPQSTFELKGQCPEPYQRTYGTVLIQRNGEIGVQPCTMDGVNVKAIQANEIIYTPFQITNTSSQEIFSLKVFPYFQGGNPLANYHSYYIGSGYLPQNNTGHSNLFLGGKSGGVNGNISGTNNVAIGLNAGRNLTTANGITLVGVSAGFDLTTGQRNAFFGFSSGSNTNTGGYNTFIGYSSGEYNITGSYNTNVGQQAGYQNTVGNNNVFIGNRSGNGNLTGSNNTFVGFQTGINSVNSSGSVFIGYSAGENETTNDKLYIDNSNTSTPLIFGDFDKNELIFYGQLDVVGSFASNTQAVVTTASLTPDIDDYNTISISLLDTNLTINAPVGTARDGQRLTIRFKDNGVNKIITYNAIYKQIGVTFPTLTSPDKWQYLEFVYNADSNNWDCINVKIEV